MNPETINRKSDYKISKMIIAIAVFVSMFAILCMAAQTKSALAQKPASFNDPATLTLRDEINSYILGPYTFVTRDPAKRLDFKTIEERHRAFRRGTRSDTRLLDLGAKGDLHWIVFSLLNKSSNSDWVLSFGKKFTGRTGMAKKIFVYDADEKRKLLDAVPRQKNNGTIGKNLNGSYIQFTLDPNESATIIIYYVPELGVPHFLPLELFPRDVYLEQSRSLLHSDIIFTLLIVIISGFFIAFIYFEKDASYLFFVLFLFMEISHFYSGNDEVFILSTMSSKMASIFLAIAISSGLVATRIFLKTRSDNSSQSYFIYGIAASILAASVIISVVSPNSMLLRPIVMFVLPASGMVTAIAISYLQAQVGAHSGYLLVSSWIIHFLGFILTTLAMLNLIQPTNIALSAYWISILLQSFLLIFATAVRKENLEKDYGKRYSYGDIAETTSITKIRQSRETADQQRLLKVIEREREVMTELREREARRTEEMRKSKEVADEANRAKSAFLAVVSHEIRTPMTGIMGMVRLLMDTKLSKEQHEYAETIQDSGDAMLALLNDILDFEKIESGKMDIEHVDFDLHRLINGVITLMSGHAAERNIYLKNDTSEDVPRYVKGDPTRLRQILLNLTGNGIKFTTEGGVTLRIRKTSSAEEPTVNEADNKFHTIYFAIEDTGVGISKQGQMNLFNPFSQADSSISRKFGGTGLGLAICKRLVEKMGGDISINSSEGEGSTFFFSLVMEIGSSEAAEEIISSSQGIPEDEGTKLHILVVDDNYINQKVIVGLVERLGHTTDVASTAEDAFRILGDNKFDVILMDIELPGMSGNEATKIIRLLPDKKSATTPIIALTGNVDKEDVERFHEANMNGVLAKPINPEKLKNALIRVSKGDLDVPIEINQSAPVPVQEGHDEIDTIETNVPNEIISQQENVSYEQNRENAEGWEDEDSFGLALYKSEIAEKPQLQNSPESTSQEVLDVEMLDSLRDNLGHDQIKELLDGVFEKSNEIAEVLEASVKSQDTETIGLRTHELKGMAGNFGLLELSSKSAKAEKAVKNLADFAEIGSLVTEICEANNKVKQLLENWLGEKL